MPSLQIRALPEPLPLAPPGEESPEAWGKTEVTNTLWKLHQADRLPRLVPQRLLADGRALVDEWVPPAAPAIPRLPEQTTGALRLSGCVGQEFVMAELRPWGGA